VDDSLVKVGPILEMVGDWKKFLEGESTADEEKTHDEYPSGFMPGLFILPA
jgi:hypothetical protein